MNTLTVTPDWAKLPLFDRKGWKRMPFGAFADSINERVEPRDAAEEIYVGLEHLDPQNLHIRRWGKGSDVIGTKLRFRKDDIIFGRRRAYQRKLAVAEMDGICSAHAIVVRAKPDVVLPEFLPFLMMSDKFMNRAVEISVGSLSPTINWTTLKLEEFDIPPLDQQRRIAEILWAVNAVMENWRETNQNARNAHAVKFKAMILGVRGTYKKTISDIDDFSPPSGWSIRFAKELVASPITKGATPSSHLNTENASVPFLKVYNLTFTGDLDFSINPTYLEPQIHQRDLKRSQVHSGDILMNLVGPPLGKTALIPDGFPEANVNQAIVIYRIEDHKMREFFLEYLRSDIAQKWLEQRSKKTSGQRNLTLALAQDLPVPIPPAEVMLEVLNTVRSFSLFHRNTHFVMNALSRIGQSIINGLWC